MASSDLIALRERHIGIGFASSTISKRHYGQIVFTDADGFFHCFGIATKRCFTLFCVLTRTKRMPDLFLLGLDAFEIQAYPLSEPDHTGH